MYIQYKILSWKLKSWPLTFLGVYRPYIWLLLHGYGLLCFVYIIYIHACFITNFLFYEYTIIIMNSYSTHLPIAGSGMHTVVYKGANLQCQLPNTLKTVQKHSCRYPTIAHVLCRSKHSTPTQKEKWQTLYLGFCQFVHKCLWFSATTGEHRTHTNWRKERNDVEKWREYWLYTHQGVTGIITHFCCCKFLSV